MVTLPQISIDTEKGLDMCFACGKNNPIGLKLKFERHGNTTRTEFTPTKLYQGWAGIVHGGIIHCLLDEAMSYAAIFEGVNCLTAKTESRLRRPALIGEPLIITSSATKIRKRLIEVKAHISLKDGTIVAEGTATMFVINKTRVNPSNKEDKSKSDA